MLGRGLLAATSVTLVLATLGAVHEVRAESRTQPPLTPPLPAPIATAAPSPAATPAGVRSTAALQQQVVELADAAGAQVGVTLVELGGPQPVSWSYQGDQDFVAASTYKLPLLMDEAQLVASGAARPGDQLTFTEADYEDGWYDDYEDGEAFSRLELAQRVGLQSDNTAAHVLVDGIGGGAALNAYARSHGAAESAFYDPNTTTASDLARLWVSEATGAAGGSAAQGWLYPLLTHTTYEAGIPAGAPAGTTVVHKIGVLDGETNDAALVLGAPHGTYVLVVMTDGPGGDAGWSLIASISRAVSAFEAAR